jgi:hypothetical protein
MLESTGLDLVIALKKQHKTQRWLLSELKENGFPLLTESSLSSILSGSYKYGMAKDVLNKSAEIILNNENNLSTQQ